MASGSSGGGSAVPPSEWSLSSPEYSRDQMVAALRAALIALFLLGVLALIILF